MHQIIVRTRQFIRDWIQPFEIVLVVAGLIVAAIAYFSDSEERRNQRLVASWQLLSEKAPGASGKKRAIDYLRENEQSLVAINLSYTRHGAPVFLQELNVYNENTKRGTDFRMASFAGAIMNRADLRGSDFSLACFYRTELGKAKLAESKLVGADLTGANLWDADLTGADLTNANLSGAHINEHTKVTQPQIDKARYCPSVGEPIFSSVRLVAPTTKSCNPVPGCQWSGVDSRMLPN